MQATEGQDLGDMLGKVTDLSTLGTEIVNNISKLNDLATQINKTFGQTRQRITDVVEEIGKATPELTRLGGTAESAAKTIESVSKATRRNVVASADTIKELYATQKVLGDEMGASLDYTIGKLQDVGISFENVQENLIGGINYVQSIGLNTQQVMEAVVDNADLLNKFNFEGGVMGLTKMAAQSAMLRVSMRDAAQFAEKVMDPEGAIQMAAGLQRLGVTTGALSDPFALLNASINDPQGLQKSLAEVIQQYTIFDDKTKSFKIDPGAIRMIKEISKVTGESYDNLTKMGLALANNDKIMSQMRFGQNLSEEEKQYIASMAQIGEGGDYVIKVRDERGKEDFKKLTEVSEEQLRATIKAQQDAPKSMEDIARASMKTTDIIAGDVYAIRQKIVQGITVAQPLRDLPEQTRALTTAATEALYKAFPDASKIQVGTEKGIDYLKDIAIDLVQGKRSMSEISSQLQKDLGDKIPNIVETFEKVPSLLSESLEKKLSGKQDPLSQKLLSELKNPRDRKEFESILKKFTTQEGLSEQIQRTKQVNVSEQKNVNVTHTGEVKNTFKIEGADGVDRETINKILDAWTRSPEFQRNQYNAMVKISKSATGEYLVTASR
jgi:hypothetical protein